MLIAVDAFGFGFSSEFFLRARVCSNGIGASPLPILHIRKSVESVKID